MSIYGTISDPGAQFGTYSAACPACFLAQTPLPLSFWLKIDTADVGIFSHTDVFTSAPAASVATNAPQASLVVSFFRPSIAKVFPLFLCLGFWVIAVFDVIFTFAFLGNETKNTNPSSISVAAGLLFALPNIRNAMYAFTSSAIADWDS